MGVPVITIQLSDGSTRKQSGHPDRAGEAAPPRGPDGTSRGPSEDTEGKPASTGASPASPRKEVPLFDVSKAIPDYALTTQLSSTVEAHVNKQ